MRFFTGNSDLLTSMAAFNQCTMHSEEGSKAGAIRDFCEQVGRFLITITTTEFIRISYLTQRSAISILSEPTTQLPSAT